MVSENKINWSFFKSIVDFKNVSIQYVDNNTDFYTLRIFDASQSYRTDISKENPKSPDQIDFETNYIPNANKTVGQSIVGQTGLVADVVHFDGKNRIPTLVSLDPGGKIIPTLGTNLFYDDMNATNGGISRGTSINNTWNKVYEQTGGNGGVLLGFLVTLEKIEESNANKSWSIRLVVDGIEIFSTNGLLISDFENSNIYGFDRDPAKDVQKGFGLIIRNNTFRFEAPSNLPVTYTTDIQIYIKKASDNKKFRAGLAILTKD